MAAPSDELLPSSVPAESLSTHWRRRRRPADAEPTDGSDDSKSVVSGCWQPDEEDAEMVSGLEQIEGLRRMKVDSGRVVRRAKRLKLDLEVSSVLADSAEFNMFSDLNLVPAEASPDEHQGGALLCFLSPETFVGFVELHHEGTRHVLQLTGSESLTECNRELCGAQDCCGDKAYVVSVQSVETGSLGRRKRRFLARSTGVGDYVAFEGRGMKFETDFVPGDEEREQVLGRHFGMLPRSVRRESVLCLGRMTLQWRGLALGSLPPADFDVGASAARTSPGGGEDGEGYAGDKSSEGSSGDDDGVERSMRAILPMLARVTMPTPSANSFSLDELVRRGGTPVANPEPDDWLDE